MGMTHNKALYVFTHDLRVSDNPALLEASARSVNLGCVACWDEKLWHQPQYNCVKVGKNRQRFMLQSLKRLDKSLRSLGQHLHLLAGSPFQALATAIAGSGVTLVVRCRQAGFDENRVWQQLQDAFPEVEFLTIDTHTLYDHLQVPAKKNFPATFSKFRRLVQKQSPRPAMPRPTSLAPSFLPKAPLPTISSASKVTSLLFRGGEDEALEHLQRYFNSDAPSTYRETRNALDGWKNSTKFSPWLAQGCVTPRLIHDTLRIYESTHGSNASTEWIYVELLWREFFFWYAYYHGNKTFRFSGVTGTKPLTSFYPQRFKSWCEGTTPWPLINACMRELRATGYMSNRGRQIVASALTNELSLDWRYGAAWFEQELLDYDVGSNWGNWQYIAGVGADARGGRHFNIEKQTQIYDPDSKFIEHWGRAAQQHSLDSVDAADWPLE